MVALSVQKLIEVNPMVALSVQKLIEVNPESVRVQLDIMLHCHTLCGKRGFSFINIFSASCSISVFCEREF
jgi:hypothetical protein